MEQQTSTTPTTISFTSLKERVQHVRADANEALTAVRHDIEQVRKALQSFRAKSQLKAYVQSRLNGAGAKPVVAKPKRAKVAR